MLWYERGDLSEVAAVPRERILVFDTETTGLKVENDEILQLSVIDGLGNVLFSDYVRPAVRQRWPKAQEINGITPAMVRDKRTMRELLPELDAIFARAGLLVAYNIEFDSQFLAAAGVRLPPVPWFDVMKEYAPVGGQWDEYHEDWRWQKLEKCARHYGYRFSAHDALEDARATLHCFYAMLADRAEGGYLSIVSIYARSIAERERKAKEREEQARRERAEREGRERRREAERRAAERVQRAAEEAERAAKSRRASWKWLIGGGVLVLASFSTFSVSGDYSMAIKVVSFLLILAAGAALIVKGADLFTGGGLFGGRGDGAGRQPTGGHFR